MKKLYSVIEAGKAIGIGKQKMYQLVKSDPDLPTVLIGSVTKINMGLIDEYLKKKCKDGEII